MADEQDLANVFRTDVRAYALIGPEGEPKQYPVTLVETMYRLDEIPFAYVEIPMGRKAPAIPTTASQDLPGAGSMVADIQPLTPIKIHVQCIPHGELPRDLKTGEKKLLGYVADGTFMTIFDGYILSPWIRKRRNGSAVLAVTAMGLIGRLAASTNYTSTITPTDSTKKINVPFGAGAKLVSSMTERIWNIKTGSSLGNGPAWNITSAILQLFSHIAVQTTPMGLPSPANNQAIPAIERLAPTAENGGGTAVPFPLNTGATAPIATPLATGAQTTVFGLSNHDIVYDIDYNKMLNWSVSRHIADLLYAGWANGIGDGGGDLWITLNLLAKSFMFSILPTARLNDFIIPIFYGIKAAPFRVIDPNEYWAVEVGKSFNPRDYSYVGSVSLWTPRAPIPTVDAQGTKTVIEMPSLGYYGLPPSTQPTGRLQTVECPTWAVPPVDLSTEWIGENDKPPEAGSPDDPAYSPARPATEFWYDFKLGNRIAQWLQGHLAYAHRVMAITGRLRFDIAPGSLVQVNTTDDIFAQNEKAEMYSLFGHVAEVRIIIGTRGKRTTAQTVLTMGHVYNEREREQWSATAHPVFGQPWWGTHLVEGAGS